MSTPTAKMEFQVESRRDHVHCNARRYNTVFNTFAPALGGARRRGDLQLQSAPR